ncbi:MAG: hypothetical protein H7A45_00265 [Verrucomicrobiales bacterium]|nr:hypothetical protein [Verrucomicrobiales bacterium]
MDPKTKEQPTKPKVDPYPKPVALSAMELQRTHRLQSEKGRDARLKRLARRNRDVAWLLTQVQGSAKPKRAKAAKPPKPDESPASDS